MPAVRAAAECGCGCRLLGLLRADLRRHPYSLRILRPSLRLLPSEKFSAAAAGCEKFLAAAAGRAENFFS